MKRASKKDPPYLLQLSFQLSRLETLATQANSSSIQIINVVVVVELTFANLLLKHDPILNVNSANPRQRTRILSDEEETKISLDLLDRQKQCNMIRFYNNRLEFRKLED